MHICVVTSTSQLRVTWSENIQPSLLASSVSLPRQQVKGSQCASCSFTAAGWACRESKRYEILLLSSKGRGEGVFCSSLQGVFFSFSAFKRSNAWAFLYPAGTRTHFRTPPLQARRPKNQTFGLKSGKIHFRQGGRNRD